MHMLNNLFLYSTNESAMKPMLNITQLDNKKLSWLKK
ncbi:Uncharacterised protein [Oligella urethralis]|nr:Uncharacterised protein [Oligella urethralis]